MNPFEEDLGTPLEKLEYLQSMLIARATGGDANNNHYTRIRKEFVSISNYKKLLPRWIVTCRNLDQFWHFIKPKFGSYAERRTFISEELSTMLDFIESNEVLPVSNSINEALTRFDSDEIHSIWSKAIERKNSDPEGAITISRTMLESVCKHILDRSEIEYDGNGIELPELYKLTSKELNLSPSQHTEQIFKQILGSCSGVVSGLGAVRNKLGDAHGQGSLPIKPKPRHAELAVNLAGSMALFLISTYTDS